MNQSGNYAVDDLDVTDVPIHGESPGLSRENSAASLPGSEPTFSARAPDRNKKRWDLNYQEAAIYLQVIKSFFSNLTSGAIRLQ